VLVTDPAGSPAAVPAGLPPGTFLVVVTSGTSGHPRPVLRTAASWTSSFGPFGDLTGIGAGDRVLLTGPLHATMHLFAAVHTLAVGGHLVDDPATATVAHAVPSRLATLLDELDELDAGAPLRTVVVAGATLPDALAARARNRGLTVVEYYGAAELSFVAARRVPGPLRPFPGADHGDGGPDGLRIRGRGDAAITTAGATVVAEDVEQALLTVPGVAAVAVVGAPHSRLGQLVVAVLEPAPGADLTGIRDAARQRLREQSLPRRWLVADTLPRTPGGKVARHAVAAALAALDGDRPAPDGAPALRPLPSTP